MEGTILFGGIDTAKFTPPLLSVPLQPDDITGLFRTMTIALVGVSAGLVGSQPTQQFSVVDAIPVVLDSGTEGMVGNSSAY